MVSFDPGLDEFRWVGYAETWNDDQYPPSWDDKGDEYFVWGDGGAFEDLFLEAHTLTRFSSPALPRNYEIDRTGDDVIFKANYAVSGHPSLMEEGLGKAYVTLLGSNDDTVLHEIVQEELGEEVYDRIRESGATVAQPQ